MCPDCQARRDLSRKLLIEHRIAEAAGNVLKGAAEVFGLRQKTGVVDLEKSGLAETPGEQTPALPANSPETGQFAQEKIHE